jgi:hypothetical protein
MFKYIKDAYIQEKKGEKQKQKPRRDDDTLATAL